MGAFSASLPAIAAPLTYDVVYVDDTGLGGDHFPTIEGALGSVNPGGIIYIAAGHYVIDGTLEVTFDLTVIGAGADVVVIDADGGDFNIFHVDGADFEISGCTLKSGRNGILVETSLNEVVITDNIIYDNNSQGIGAYLRSVTTAFDGNGDDASYLTISGNEIYSNDTQGVYLSVFESTGYIEVMENEIHDNGYAGIELFGDIATAVVEIYSNMIYGNGDSTGDTGILVNELANLDLYLEIYENEISNESGNGIHITCNTEGFHNYEMMYIYDYISIYDNDIFDCGKNGIYVNADIDLNMGIFVIIGGDEKIPMFRPEYIEIYGNNIESNDQDGIFMDIDVDMYGGISAVEGPDGNEPPICSMITIEDNEVFANERMGIYIAGELSFNPLDPVAPLDGDDGYIYYELVWVYRNEVYDNLGGGVILSGLPCTIENNLIAGNFWALEFGQLDGQPAGAGIFAVGGSYAYIDNNTVLANTKGIEYGNTHAEIINNIVCFNDTGIYYFGCAPEGFDEANGSEIIYNNDVWDNCIDYFGLPDQTGINGNISEDPLFYGMYDARLTQISPCIDTGYPGLIGWLTEDIDSTQRPLGLGIDMGCYEMPGNIWSPKYVQPLATLSIAKANSMWGCIMENLPADLSEEAEMLIEEIQTLMGQAGSLANPVFTNGLMQQALGLMEELNGILGCGCHS